MSIFGFSAVETNLQAVLSCIRSDILGICAIKNHVGILRSASLDRLNIPPDVYGGGTIWAQDDLSAVLSGDAVAIDWKPNDENQITIMDNSSPVEELAELLRTEGKLDTSRLSAEGQAILKSFEKGYTPKFQEVAELKKQLETELQQKQQEAQNKNLDPRETYFREFLGNPQKVFAEINAEIEKLEVVSPYDENAFREARKTIVQLNKLKDEFISRKEEIIARDNYIGRIGMEVEQEIFKAIPDYDVKMPELAQLATEAGLSNETILALTNPATLINTPKGYRPIGKMAAEIIKAVHYFHGKLNVAKTANEKEVKPKAPVVNRPGSVTTSAPSANNEEDTEAFINRRNKEVYRR